VTSSTGNLEVAVIIDDAADSVSACTDNKSQTYTVSAAATSTSGNVYFCYKFSSTTGVTSIIITHAGGHLTTSVYDISSTSGGALDGSIVALSAQNSANPAPAVTAAGAGIALVGESSVNPITQTVFTQDTIATGSINNWAAAAHVVNGSGGTQTASSTMSSGVWCSLIAEFKEAVAGAAASTIARPAKVAGPAKVD
jgi:hypothetical protein